MVYKTLKKSRDIRVYDAGVVFSSKDERTLEPKRISSAFPNDQLCVGKYKLKLTTSRQNKVNIEIMYVNSKCSSPALRHQCDISLSLKKNSKLLFKDHDLCLHLKCHTWRHITSINAKLSDRFEFNVKGAFAIQPKLLTFQALEDEVAKDFTIQGANGFSRQVHKSVLNYSSSVFRRILNKSNKNCLNFNADSVTLSEFIDFMYSGKQPRLNLTEVLQLAREFEMKDLASKCIAELLDTVNVYNAVSLLNFAMANQCPSLVFGIVYFIKLHSEEIVNENVKTMTNGETVKNNELSSFINDYVDSASDILAIKKELFPNDV